MDSSTLSRRAFLALVILRALPALLIVVHGTARIASGGVGGFGEFLGSQHLPLGLALAWVISIVEVAGGLTLVLGYLVIPLCGWFAAELAVGVVLVHAQSGWFVVGGGRNGMEYSVLLIGCFLVNAALAPFVRQLRSSSKSVAAE